MSINAEFIRGLFILLLVVLLAGGLVYWTMKNSADPGRMLFKWILTAIMLGVLFGVVGPIVGEGGYGGAFVGIPATAVCGLVFFIIWRHSICGLVAKPFTSLYDGGDAQIDPQPMYSTARARQKQGRYLEAVAEVRDQLNRFPTDVEGHLLLAEIQAENLKDLEGAGNTIHRFCSQLGHAPKNIAYALYSLADWHLSVAQDREGARAALERIIELLPDTELSLGAAQRIAHLATPDKLLEPFGSRSIPVQRGEQKVGLMESSHHLRPTETDPAQIAAEYVAHLEQHPLDFEAREKLAGIYASHFQRLDLAVEQLEEMIGYPNQSRRNIVRWLNFMVDLQVRSGADYEEVKRTLERIIELDPRVAAADLARNRLNTLKLELRGKEKGQAVKLGTYEQNIGLKSVRGLGLRKQAGQEPSA